VELLLVFSGREHDFRNPGHFDSIKRYIAENGLENNVKLLGLIPFIDVHYLMRNSVSVINPSFFEGWSTTVEEVKTIGKHIILSNLGVHREQAPPSAQFFDPSNEAELAGCLVESWVNRSAAPDLELERGARAAIDSRTKLFGVKYAQCIREVVAC
jgi:glycosyltransferase involved in cell wall biosynthesis